MKHVSTFEKFLGESEELNDATIVNGCLRNFNNSVVPAKFDEQGRIILRMAKVRVVTDKGGYKQLPFAISPKSRKDITFRFDDAKQLESLQGFPPLPEANFLIWHDSTTSVPKSVRDLLLSPWEAGGDFGWKLTEMGLTFLKSGLSWEDFAKKYRGAITGKKYGV